MPHDKTPVHPYLMRGLTPTERLDKIVDKAEQAFWEEVAKRVPEAKTGDLDPAEAAKLTDAMRQAVDAWIIANVPGEKSARWMGRR